MQDAISVLLGQRNCRVGFVKEASKGKASKGEVDAVALRQVFLQQKG